MRYVLFHQKVFSFSFVRCFRNSSRYIRLSSSSACRDYLLTLETLLGISIVGNKDPHSSTELIKKKNLKIGEKNLKHHFTRKQDNNAAKTQGGLLGLKKFGKKISVEK